MALWPLHLAFGLKRYFAAPISRFPARAPKRCDELEDQVQSHAKGTPIGKKVYPYQIAFNVIPQVDSFGTNGYTGEETKMMQESRRSWACRTSRFRPRLVRVPVVRAHSIAVNAEFERPVSVEAARAAIAAFSGAQLVDDPAKQSYPTPLDFSRKAKCGVGRIRLDTALDNGLALWVSGDNLWKGAALNALQNAELMVREGWLKRKRTARDRVTALGCRLRRGVRTRLTSVMVFASASLTAARRHVIPE